MRSGDSILLRPLARQRRTLNGRKLVPAVRDPLSVMTMGAVTVVLAMIGFDLHSQRPTSPMPVTVVASEEGAPELKREMRGPSPHTTSLPSALAMPTRREADKVKPRAPRLMQRRGIPSRPCDPRGPGTICACSCSLWPVQNGSTRPWGSTSIRKACHRSMIR